MNTMLRPALISLLLLTLLTGFLYPLVVTAAAALVFPHQAGGSLMAGNGAVIGSSLIGQPFDDPRYFHGRPSSTARMPYDAGASAGSNYGPLNPALLARVRERGAALKAEDPGNGSPIPVDLVTASASGLDPHISPAAAYWQIARVARSRALSEDRVRDLVARHVEGRQYGLFGEPRVNVLRLNLALDELASGAAGSR